LLGFQGSAAAIVGALACVFFPFASSDGEMGLFGAIVVVQPAILVAVFRADFTLAARIVSQKTSTLRCAGSSSPSPRLSLERKHGQIACWMTAARKRRRLQEFRAIGLSPEADDPGLWRDGSAQA
jgi:hypothetical protein